jgi:spermidine synthase
MSPPEHDRGARLLAPLSVLFFVSGATALAAEVVLNKLLTYVFGSSHLATSTVLAAYMAGLTAGARLAGGVATRLRRPVLTYAGLELVVGAFYASLPLLFGPYQRLALACTAPFAASPGALTAVRFSLAFALVFVPTLLMGGTLPVLVAALRGTALVRGLPRLYGLNTLGAAAGTLVASYAALPALGLDGTLFACAALNVVVALASAALARRAPEAHAPDAHGAEPDASDAPAWHLSAAAIPALAFAQGVLSFALEVVWSHLIGTVIGVTTYAFALMLFAILVGIGLGSALLPWLARVTRRPPAAIFAGALVVLALGVAISLRAWDRFGLVVAATPSLGGDGRFWGRELVRLAFCLALLLPASLAMGVALPALAAAGPSQKGSDASWVGRVFAANTLGTISGSLFTGFVLLGRVGSDRILEVAIAGALVVAAVAVALGRTKDGAPVRAGLAPHAALGAAAVALTLTFPGWDRHRLTLGCHYYWETPEEADAGEVVALREDAQSGFVTVTRAASGVSAMRTNGKYEGNDAGAEFQDLFALIGGLYVKRFDRAALIGMGPSRTLRVLYDMPFKAIDAVEYSPAILATAYADFPRFAKVPFDDHARVKVVCDDGRNFLQLSRDPYDFITVSITGAAFAGSGNIYSRDFFRAAKERLRPDGVFLVWVQLHHVFPEDVRSVVYSARSVFPSVHLYTDAAHGQGYLVASPSELVIDADDANELGQRKGLRETLAAHNYNATIELVDRSVLVTDAELERWFADRTFGPPPQLLTDLRPAFEYSTPYALVDGPPGGTDFQPLSDKRLPRFDPPLPEDARLLLEARRFLAAGEPARALASVRRAKELHGGTTEWDWWIRDLEVASSR